MSHTTGEGAMINSSKIKLIEDKNKTIQGWSTKEFNRSKVLQKYTSRYVKNCAFHHQNTFFGQLNTMHNF